MSPFHYSTPSHRHQSTRALMAFTAIAGILAITLQACGGGGGGSASSGSSSGSSGTPPVSNTPPITTPTAATFNVKSADLLYTTAQPISVGQLQTGLAVKNPALPLFVSGKNAAGRNGLVAGVAANSSAFNLVTVGSDGMSSQTIQSQYLNRVLYTASPPNFDLINGRALTDPHVYIAFTADPYAGDTVDYSEFIAKNIATPCALYRVNTNTNEANCALPNVEPMAYFDENRNWGLFDGGNRKPIQFDAQGNIYVAGYPFTVNNGKVLKRSTATLYKLQANTFAPTALTQDNEGVSFFAIFPSGEPVVAIKRNTGMDLVLFRDNGIGSKRYTIASSIAEPFVNTDTYRTLIYGSASGTKGINLVRTKTGKEGVERASIDYNTLSGTNYNLQAGGKTYSGLVPRRIISGDDGKFYTVYSASDSNQNNVLLVYQTLPFAKNAVAVIPVTGEWWTWMKTRPIQIKRGILYYADVQDRANIGAVDVIKVIRLNDGTTQVLFANKNYRIDSWQAQGDTLHFSGIDNDANQVVQGKIDTKRIAQQNDWSATAWMAFTPSNVKATASATAASLRIQDMESLHPQQPLYDTGMAPSIVAFDSTDKSAILTFTKYMNMLEVENKLLITHKSGAADPVAAPVVAPVVFPLWGYQSLHLVYDTSNGTESLSDNITTGLPVGAGSFAIESTDNLFDAYGWSVPKTEVKYTVTEKQNESGIYSVPVAATLGIDSQPGTQTVIAGRAATFRVLANGTQPITYQWKKNGINIPGATQSSYTTPATTGLDDDALFAVELKNASGTLLSHSAKLGVTVPPAVLTQPTAQTVTEGQAASFSVTASGTPILRYQWKKNGADIADANSSSYTTLASTLADNGAIYLVQISNGAGSATSGTARLSVIPAVVAPSIDTQPSSQTVNAGQAATFQVTASGTAPLGYQWQKNGSNISGANSSSYTTPVTSSADNGAVFTVNVSNSAGTAASTNATLTVNIGPSITTQPAASQTITAGQTVSFGVVASGTAPLSYQWKKNGSNIAGATSSTYTTPAMAVADSGAVFTVEISNMAGTVSSNSATVTVNPVAVAPAITVQPGSLSVTAGQTATFSVTARGTAPVSYQWRKNGSNIAGATSSSYTTPATSSDDNGALFTVIVSNSALTVTSSDATLTVNVVPTISTQPASQTVTAGQTVSFGVVATGTAPLSYQWRKNGSNISGATLSMYTTPATVDGDNGAVFTVVISNVAGTVTSNSATVTVNPAPVAPAITAQPGSLSVTAGQTATFSVTASGTAPLSYQWRKNGSNISGATSSSYTTPATVVGDSGATFTVVIANTAGSVTSNSATLTVTSAATGPTVSAAAKSVRYAASGSQDVDISGSGFTGSSWHQFSTNGGTSWAYADTQPVINSATSMTVSVSRSLPAGTELLIRMCSNKLASAVCSSGYLTVTIDVYYSTIGAFTTQECVKDDLTGYVWEGKPTTGTRASSNTYTNYDASYTNGTDINASGNSIGYVNAVNASALCGFTDWRLPTKDELQTILESSRTNPSINTTWFPNTQTNYYLTSTPNVNVGYFPYYYTGIRFDTGYIENNLYRPSVYPVRLVRTSNTQPVSQSVFEGQTATFVVNASGALSYQWKKNGTNISGATASSYIIPATSLSDNGAVISVAITNNAGTVFSSGAILKVTPPKVINAVISVTPAASGTENVAISGSGFSASSIYQVSTNGGVWANGTAALTYVSASSLTVPVSKSQTVGNFVRIRVCGSTNANAGCSSEFVAVFIGNTQPNIRYSSIGSYTKEECVKDDATGLVWEGKSTTGTRAASNIYTNYHISYYGTQAQMDAANNTYGFANEVNNSALCGYTDWRLPTKEELQTIVDASRTYPSINTTWFPNTQSSYYWSSTPNGNNNNYAWYVYFGNGYVDGWLSRGYDSAVRLVRSGPPIVTPATVDVTRAASGTQAVSISGNGFSVSNVYQISNNHGVWINGAVGTLIFNSATSLTVAVDKTLAEGTFLQLRVCSSSTDDTSCSKNYVAVNIGDTKSSGNRYSAVGSYTKKECVKDDATGLIWEGKTASPATSRLGFSTYTNYDSTTGLQSPIGTNVTQAQIDASTNSIGYKNSVNTSALCGFTDWRLPTKEELQGIVASSGSLRINSAWFPNTTTYSGYWSSSPNVDYTYNAWVVAFINGHVDLDYYRSSNHAVRLVRASQ